MELNDVFTNVAILRALATLLAALVLIGFIVVVTEKSIAGPVTRGIEWIIRYRKPIMAQVDEATDSLPVRLEKETGIPAAVWVKLLTAAATGVFEGLEAIPLGEKSPVPMVEVTPPAAETFS